MGALGAGSVAKMAFHMVADTSQFTKKLELAGADITKLNKNASASSKITGAVTMGAAAGFTAMAGGMAASVKTFQEYGQGIKAIDRATEMGAQSASTLNALFSRYNVTGNQAKMGLRTFAQVLTMLKHGSEAQQKAAAAKFELAGVDAAR